eukprot:388884-Pleurochrysis_carterae.AAC.2
MAQGNGCSEGSISHRDTWGHPVATVPVTNGTIRHTCKMPEILRIITPSPGNKVTMPGFDLNHLAHQQPHLDVELVGNALLTVDSGDHARNWQSAFRRVITFELIYTE